ncbi:MAG: META domain-containing protein [Campylobacterota bacterium]|nr:META domain-containing protein [Campylobacterota bacterium]
MRYKTLCIALFMVTGIEATTLTLDDKVLNGNWHLRKLDGKEVRKARAIVEFSTKEMRIQGFDSCNRIDGLLKKDSEYSATVPLIRATRMACRTTTQRWVSKKLHKTLKEGFHIKKETKHGVDGITLKSENHELFFKKMDRKL